MKPHFDAAARTYTLDVTQTCAPTPGQAVKAPFVIPLALGLLDAGGRELPLPDAQRLITDPSTREVLGVTVLQATPATWRLMLAAGWKGSPGLKILCGGEPLPRDLAAELLPRVAQSRAEAEHAKTRRDQTAMDKQLEKSLAFAGPTE